jgi:RNA polymerase sigma-70 factor (ECF subfamily)
VAEALSAAQRAEQSGWMARIAARGADGEAALEQLFKAYERRTVRRLQGRFGLDQSEAEDVWQDALLDLWNNAASFRPGADLAPWLQTLTNHRALKLLDSAWRRHRSDLKEDDGAPDAADEAAEPDAAPVSGPSAGPPRNLDADGCTDQGLDRFERQHPREARWLLARDLEGRDVPSLAAEMGCSETAARQRLRLLRQKLRPFLQHCVELLASA